MLKDDKIQKIYGESDGIAKAEILTVTEADNGDIIAGSDGGGIYVINESGTQNINTSTGLSSNVVMRVKKDIRLNIYWIITSNAIAYMDEKYKVETVTGFPYSNNFDLYQNSINETWVVSSNGLYVATTREDLLSARRSRRYSLALTTVSRRSLPATHTADLRKTATCMLPAAQAS